MIPVTYPPGQLFTVPQRAACQVCGSLQVRHVQQIDSGDDGDRLGLFACVNAHPGVMPAGLRYRDLVPVGSASGGEG